MLPLWCKSTLRICDFTWFDWLSLGIATEHSDWNERLAACLMRNLWPLFFLSFGIHKLDWHFSLIPSLSGGLQAAAGSFVSRKDISVNQRRQREHFQNFVTRVRISIGIADSKSWGEAEIVKICSRMLPIHDLECAAMHDSRQVQDYIFKLI